MFTFLTQPKLSPTAVFLSGSDAQIKYYMKHLAELNGINLRKEALWTRDCLTHGAKYYHKQFLSNNLKVLFVICLRDALVPFQDELNHLLDLPNNDCQTSSHRRNKHLMHETIANSKIFISLNNNDQSQLRSGKHFEIFNFLASADDKESFEISMAMNDLQYPIVIKPPTACCTQGVRLCYSYIAIKDCVDRFLNQKNFESNVNFSLMAQEFLNGDEYVVNTVSYDGKHKVTDMWRGYKNIICDNPQMMNIENVPELQRFEDSIFPYCFLFDYQDFILSPTSNSIHMLIIDYTLKILDALGVKYGCSHVELMYLPKEKNVCLIELNARTHGGLPRAYPIVGYDQLTVFALSLVDPKQFLLAIPDIYDVSSVKNIEKYDAITDDINTNISSSVSALTINDNENKDEDDLKLITISTLTPMDAVHDCRKNVENALRNILSKNGVWKKYLKNFENEEVTDDDIICLSEADWQELIPDKEVCSQMQKLFAKNKENTTDNDPIMDELAVDMVNKLTIEDVDDVKEINDGNVKNKRSVQTVRPVFLNSAKKGYLNFSKVIEITKLPTFDWFARELFQSVDKYTKYNQELKSYQTMWKMTDDHETKIFYAKKITEFERKIQYMTAVKKSIDLASTNGCVILRGTIEELDRDLKFIRDLELLSVTDNENGLYGYY